MDLNNVMSMERLNMYSHIVTVHFKENVPSPICYTNIVFVLNGFYVILMNHSQGLSYVIEILIKSIMFIETKLGIFCIPTFLY